MSDMEFRPNSNAYKERQKEAKSEDKRAEKVVKGAVKTKKKSGISKLGDVFISEDVGNVKSYIILDVLIPAAKKAISDIVTNGIDMILYGGSGRPRREGTNASYVSYSRFSDRGDRRDDRRSDASRTRSRFDYNEKFFERRTDAEEVLRTMDGIMDQYNIVRVADFYDIIGESCEHTCNKYGWTDLSTAKVERTYDGYRIKLPRALPID
jgi:hypothetical protein